MIRRIIICQINLPTDDAQDHSELGAALNGFSLNENDELASAIEKTGQAIDATYLSTTQLVRAIYLQISHHADHPTKTQELEQNWAEPLHEYAQFAAIIKKILSYRHQKHVQYEMTQDALESKKESLEELEKSEREARRLEAALGRGRVNGPSLSSRASEGGGTEAADPSSPNEEEEQNPASGYLPPHPGPNPARKRSRTPGMGLLNALSYTLHGMMDVDPETARRNSISKTRETISQASISVWSFCYQTSYASSICLNSWRMLYIYPLKISSTPARLFRQIWTDSSGRRWPI